jgi:hypothetical protein
MVAPAAAAAAGWTIEQIAAGVGIAGTVGGGVGSAAASGGSGWNYDGPNANLLYPSEIGADLWNNECFVRFHGLFSHSSEPPQCYSNHDHPQVPVNRFIEVGFTKGGEDLSSGLLSCSLSSFAHVHGSPEDPYLILYAAGHFDPVGSGDAEYGFWIYLSTFGTVHLGPIEVQTGGISISQNGDEICVKLNQ